MRNKLGEDKRKESFPFLEHLVLCFPIWERTCNKCGMQRWEVFHRVARNFSICDFCLEPRWSEIQTLVQAQIGQSFKSMTGENAMKAGGGFQGEEVQGIWGWEFRPVFSSYRYYPSNMGNWLGGPLEHPRTLDLCAAKFLLGCFFFKLLVVGCFGGNDEDSLVEYRIDRWFEVDFIPKSGPNHV